MEAIKKTKPSSSHSNKSDAKTPFLGIQAKLNVNKPGDKYEVEADQAAEKVVSKESAPTPAFVPSTSPVQLKEDNEQPAVQQKPIASGITPFVQAKEEEPAQAKEEEVQAKEEEAQAKEDEAQAKEEEPAQAKEEEVQAKEEEVQAKEDEAQAKEEEPAQAKEEEVQAKEEEVQAKEEEVQAKEEEPAQAKEEEVQAKEEEVQAKEDEAQAKEEEPAQAKEEEAQAKEEEIQTKLQPSVASPSKPNINDQLRSSKGAGSGLSEGVKSEMESGFGADFSNVKIHTDDRAASMSKEIGAQAFTNKGDIYFNQGKFNPASEQGKTLLAHELTHTIQQGAATPKKEEAPAAEEKAPADGKTATPGAAPQASETGQKEETPAEAVVAAGTSASTSVSTPASTPAAANVAATEPAEVAPIPGTPMTAEALEAEAGAEGEAVEEEAAEPSIVRDPKQNPNFQAVVTGVGAAADSQTEHDPAEELSGDAQQAAESPDNERSSMAQANQVEEMEAQEPQEFSAKNFKAMLMARIEEMQLPQNNDEADKFEENNNIDEVNKKAVGDVNKEKDAAAGPIEQTTTKEPNTAAVPEREVETLVPPVAGAVPGSVSANKAVPERRPESEVSKPLQEDASELDTKMAENNVTDHQLEISEEPKFQEGLASKNEAKTNAATAPTGLRSKEQAALQKNATASEAASQDQLAGMNALRGGAMDQVLGNQKTTGTKDTGERERIAGEINKIYDTTKTDVTTILDGLELKVTEMFEYGSAQAKEKFEQHVALKMWMYKAERYSGITGAAAWLYDLFAGLPDEVNDFFKEGRDIFIKVMDEHITKIAEYVAQELTRAKQRIEQGKQEVNDYVESLPKNLQKFGKEAAEEIQEKFEDLQNEVNSKQEELVDTLASEYVAALEEVDERIEEMKAENRGLIDMAMDFINGIIDTINKLIELINSLLAAIASVIDVIMADPIGFMSNLFDGIGQGIDLFKANIEKHLLGGLIEWLTGSLGPMGITIPDDIFSLGGVFNLVMQVLGLSWDFLRMKSVKMMGEPTVKALETGADEGFAMFTTFKTKGIAGIWEYMQDKFADLQETVIGAIKEMLITQVIEAGIKWLLSLLIPGAGFIKAIMAIKDVIVFFVESAIMLIPALIEAIMALAAGSVAGVAKAIEFGLAKLIPLVIGLFAKLIGLGGLSKRVMKIFKKIRKRIDKVVNKLLAKAKKAGRKIMRKLGLGSKEKPKNPEQHDMQVKSGMKYLHQQEKALDSDSDKAITPEEANKVAAKTKKKFKVFDSITPRKNGNKWVYDWKGSSGSENGASVDTEVEGDGTPKGILKQNQGKVHTAALATVQKTVEKIELDEAKKKGNEKLKSWSGLQKRIEETSPADDLHKNPITNSDTYGAHTRGQVEAAANKALSGQTDAEKKEAIKAKTKEIESKTTSRAYVSLRNQILDKSKENESNERLEAAFKGEEGEHDNYKILATDLNFDGTADGKLVVNYSYTVQQEGQPPEQRSFTVTMEPNGNVITQQIEGVNLGIKDPGRGTTKSADNKESREALTKAPANTNNQLGSVKTASDTADSNDQRIGIASSEHYNKQVDLKTINFNASHLIADWFNGSGYSSALNLVQTSEYYNKEVMGGVEKQIVRGLETEQKSLTPTGGAGKYITFDALVTAKWQEITDNVIVNMIKTETNAALKASSPEQKESILQKLVTDLNKERNPKYCMEVNYIIDQVVLKNAAGVVISPSAYTFDKTIGEDTHLKDVLKK